MLQRIKPFLQNGGGGRGEKRPSVISQGTTVRGEIQGEGSLQVWGWVEGNISLTGDAVIDAEAEVQADISATRIIVGGSVKGSLIASEKVEVLPTGKVRGDIRAKVLLVHEGASLTGEVQSGVSPESKMEELEEKVNREEVRTFWNQQTGGRQTPAGLPHVAGNRGFNQ